MLKTSEIFKVIRQTLAEQWPDRMVYTDTVPEDFERPAFFVQYIGTKPPEDVNIGTIAMTHNFEIVIYGQKNEDWITMQEELMDLQQEVLLLFAFGKIHVEDRWPDVKASASAGKNDEAYVQLQIEYWDDRPMVSQQLPMMEEVSTRIVEGNKFYKNARKQAQKILNEEAKKLVEQMNKKEEGNSGTAKY